VGLEGLGAIRDGFSFLLMEMAIDDEHVTIM
jgi:hypothetical protein